MNSYEELMLCIEHHVRCLTWTTSFNAHDTREILITLPWHPGKEDREPRYLSCNHTAQVAKLGLAQCHLPSCLFPPIPLCSLSLSHISRSPHTHTECQLLFQVLGEKRQIGEDQVIAISRERWDIGQ